MDNEDLGFISFGFIAAVCVFMLCWSLFNTCSSNNTIECSKKACESGSPVLLSGNCVCLEKAK